MIKDKDWSDELNHRRGELIHKEIYASLTAEETAELADLQRRCRAYVNRVAPLPLKETEAFLNELKAKYGVKDEENT